MSQRYEEILNGESVLRAAPGQRHERIRERLQRALEQAVAANAAMRLLAPRQIIELTAGTLLRPDATVVATATGRAWLAVEVIEAGDQHVDTVRKKEMYENARIPRLWMVDVRYDNVEIYSGGPHGLALQHILATRDCLSDKLLPGLQLPLMELFAG
jgi:Uma2 family endonuclease